MGHDRRNERTSAHRCQLRAFTVRGMSVTSRTVGTAARPRRVPRRRPRCAQRIGYRPPVHLPWRLNFDLEIPGRSPGDVRELCMRRGFRLSGLRMRVSADRLRARYVADDAASAPLLKARLLVTNTGTRVVGQVHLTALIINSVMYVGFGLLVGLGLVGAGIATHAWQAVALGTPLVLVSGWFSIDAVRNMDALEGYRVAFERALLEAFARE